MSFEDFLIVGENIQSYFVAQVALDGNSTFSELPLTPEHQDNGKNLTCRAENTKLVNNKYSAKEANINLEVLCK